MWHRRDTFLVKYTILATSIRIGVTLATRATTNTVTPPMGGLRANLVLVAQLVEHKAENLGVIGSSPI
jgi:hypothetical protein